MSDVFELGADPSIAGMVPLPQSFNPADLNGTFSGLGDELTLALPRAALGAAATVNMLASPLARTFGQDAQDAWYSAMVDPPLRSLDQLDERSAIHGTAARVIGSFAKVAPEALLGPTAFGALEGVQAAGRAARAGAENPLALGSLTAATNAVGVALPLSLPVKAGFGPALLQRMSYGIGANVALGTAQRAGEAALGEDVKVLDHAAMTVDALLGTFFGGLAHLHSPKVREGIDAAMTVIEQASAQRVIPPEGRAGFPPGFEPKPATLEEQIAAALANDEGGASITQADIDALEQATPESAAALLETINRRDRGRTSSPQQALDHLASKAKAQSIGADLADPPVAAAAAPLLDTAAHDAERTLRAAEPKLAMLDRAGDGKPETLPKVEVQPEPAPKEGEPKAAIWQPVNSDGEQVSIDLPTLRAAAAQMDALGLKAEDGSSYGEILKAATKTTEDAGQLLDAVSQCILNYGN